LFGIETLVGAEEDTSPVHAIEKGYVKNIVEANNDKQLLQKRVKLGSPFGYGLFW
jgi:hypothetical protein